MLIERFFFFFKVLKKIFLRININKCIYQIYEVPSLGIILFKFGIIMKSFVRFGLLSAFSIASICAEDPKEQLVDTSIVLLEEQIASTPSDELDVIAKRDKKDFLLSNIEKLSKEHFEEGTDAYLEGYIQALLDVHYYEFGIVVYVKDANVTLYNLPNNALFRNSILTFVEGLPEVKEVSVSEKSFSDQEAQKKEDHVIRKQVSGIWFPQSTLLYQPMIADPRETIYQAQFRYDDKVMGKYTIGVEFGDYFPLFRWRNILPWKGDLQFDIQAGMWANFKMGSYNNPNHEISELVTTDYLIGFPLSYAVDKWAFRLRAYHISSHLGDEFMFNHPGYPRKNPSFEAIDLFTSYQATEGIRVYFGPGWVFHSDDTYKLKPFYIEWGAEFRAFGKSHYGTPYLAIFMRNWQTMHWQFDGTYQLGYEWSKLQGVGRKVRVYVQYHHGYSEGQFFKDKVGYFAAGFSYGF